MTERIDFTKSEQYTLSIRLSADGFSFSIYNPLGENSFCFDSYTVNASCSMTANIKEMLTSTEALKYPYKRINILVQNVLASIPCSKSGIPARWRVLLAAARADIGNSMLVISAPPRYLNTASA